MRINNFKDLVKASANAMKTTYRVGDPREDVSMSVARPILSKINELGFVTDDSQMGKKDTYDIDSTEKFGTIWQRSYVSGFMSKHEYKQFQLRMDLIGGCFVLIKPYCENRDIFMGHGIPVTRITDWGGNFNACTRTWTDCPVSIEPQWINLLPELKIQDNYELMNRIEKEVVYVSVTDMTWGRGFWLFDTIVRALSGNVEDHPVIKQKSI